MKYFKTQGLYKASNVTFNPTTLQAFSYGWWKFVDRIDGKIVFNNYRYSNTTSKHQYKIRCLLEELGISIDLEIPARQGLDHSNKASRRKIDHNLKLIIGGKS